MAPDDSLNTSSDAGHTGCAVSPAMVCILRSKQVRRQSIDVGHEARGAGWDAGRRQAIAAWVRICPGHLRSFLMNDQA